MDLKPFEWEYVKHNPLLDMSTNTIRYKNLSKKLSNSIYKYLASDLLNYSPRDSQ